jgi:hypothetical protein
MASEEEEDEDVEKRVDSDGGDGPHFFPRRPIERARASCMLYSTPSSVKSKAMLNLSFSGRLPGAGGAIISAYREAAVEVKVVGKPDDVDDDDPPTPLVSLFRGAPELDEEAERGSGLVEGNAFEDGGPRLWNSRYLVFSLSTGLAPLFIPLR